MTSTLRTLALALVSALVLACAAVAAAAPAHPARYRVTFTATWSVQTHPQDFPSNAHFSKLIGGTHDETAVFWSVGDTATLGIERMAEWGSVTPLDDEVLAEIVAGRAGEVIESATNPVSPGSVSTEFGVEPVFPLVSLVTMVAPSPDWFVGVAGLDLRDGDAWAEEVVAQMWAYDAGTDGGATYTAGNADTSPQEPIAAITGYPFEPGVPLGTMTFTLLTSATDVPPAPRPALSAAPNPFNPRTTVSLTNLPAGAVRVDVHDLRGRAVRTLWNGPAATGRLDLTWDGRDDGGRALPSAVYLVRASIGTASISSRVTLQK